MQKDFLLIIIENQEIGISQNQIKSKRVGLAKSLDPSNILTEGPFRYQHWDNAWRYILEKTGNGVEGFHKYWFNKN